MAILGIVIGLLLEFWVSWGGLQGIDHSGTEGDPILSRILSPFPFDRKLFLIRKAPELVQSGYPNQFALHGDY